MDSISSTKAKEAKTTTTGCFLCRQVEESVECDKCQAVWFCATHRPLHREIVDQEGRCYPYRVAESLKRGRHLVATRDLEAGSLVFRESPVLLGPLHETPPVCLGCFRPLTEDTTRLCFSCQLPLCTEEDQCSHRDLHVNFECSVLANLGDDKASSLVTEALESRRIYQCIAPLRVLLLKDSHPDKWAAVKAMMDHVEEKRHEPHWQEVEANVVRYICGFLGNRFSPEEVNHVVGVLEVNAFEVKTDEGHVARGLYPLTALMSHECLSNTRYIFREGTLESECRTTIPISKGKEILDHYVSPLEGTRFRQKKLREGWCFDCDCQRCCDPTELQTNFSSAICGNCNAALTVVNPLDDGSMLTCQSCDAERPANELMAMEDQLLLRLDHIQKSPEELLQVLSDYGKIFHPNHHLLIAAKRYLMYTLPLGDSQRIRLAMDVLAVYDVIVPGMTKERGLTMFEIHANCLFAIKKKLQEPITAEEVGSYKIRVEQAVAMGRLAQLCLTNDDRKNDFCGTIKNTLVQTLKLGLKLSEALSDAVHQ